MQAVRLIVMLGLPGSGKSTIADGLSRALGIPVASVDPIEAALWRGGLKADQTGIAAYRVAEAVAGHNLSNGVSVIVDAVCPVEASRAMWRVLAERHGARLSFIHCTCSDETMHRARIARRVRNIEGMPETSWERVMERRSEFEPVLDACLTLDTTARPAASLVAESLEYIRSA